VQHFRAGVRLAAFRESGYKMLLQGGEVANEEEVSILEENFGVSGNGVPATYPMNGRSQNGHKVALNGLDGKDGFVSKSLEGRAVAALNRFGQNAKMASDPMWMRRLQPTPEPPGNIRCPSIIFCYLSIRCLRHHSFFSVK
jgi:peroxin-16